MTSDGTNTYQWDAEGRLLVVLNGQAVAISTNTYNALGQRVRDVTPSGTTDEAYGADGELIWRYTGGDSNTRAFVPFEGRTLAEYYAGSTPGTIFDHPDELGSFSTSSDYTGNNLNEKLFYPYGELWTGAGIPSLGMHQEFAQLPDYDAETDQYNTLNRHYSPSGRWMSPDPGGVKVVKLDDPQTWNMYAYVRNNPTTLTDPTGLAPIEQGLPQQGPIAELASDWDDFSGDNMTDSPAQKEAQAQDTHTSIQTTANVVYNETAGLANSTGLHEGRVAEATVFDHHPNAFPKGEQKLTQDQKKVIATDPNAKAAMADSRAAAKEAVGRPDIGQHAITWDPTANVPHVSWMNSAYVTETGGRFNIFGPFLNLNQGRGGPVPKGDWTFIVIMQDVPYKER